MVKQKKRRQPDSRAANDRPAREGHSSRGRAALNMAIIAAAVWLAFGRSLDAPFVYDDSTSIVHNRSIQQLFPLWGDEARPGPLSPPRDTSVAGRPMTNLTFALNYAVGALNPRGYHVVNVSLHMLAAWLLWSLVRRTLDQQTGSESSSINELLAICVAIVWAVHPLQTEAVQYLAQRTELLMAVCYLATLLASLHYWNSGTSRARRGWLFGAVAACALGMGCKEVMVSAPVVVLLYDRTFVSSSVRAALGKSWPLYLGLASTWLVLVILNWQGTRSETAGFHLAVPASVWWCTQCKVLWLYLKLFVWPWPLVIHYELPLLDSWRSSGPWVVLTSLLLIVTAVQLYRRTAGEFLWSTIFLILAPTMIVPIVTEIAAERRMYLPVASLVILLVVGSYRLTQSALARKVDASFTRDKAARAAKLTTCLCAGLAIAYVAVDLQRLAMYRDEIALWQDTLTHADSALVRMNLGLALINAGRPAEAIEHYEHLLQSEPENEVTHRNNLAYAYLHAGRMADAITAYRSALRLDNQSVEAHNNLAMALLNANQPQEAAEHFRAALQLKPDYTDGHLGLGMALFAARQYAAAADEFEELRRARPDSIEANMHLAKTYVELGNPAAARAAAVRAIGLARGQGQVETARQIEAWLTASQQSSGTP